MMQLPSQTFEMPHLYCKKRQAVITHCKLCMEHEEGKVVIFIQIKKIIFSSDTSKFQFIYSTEELCSSRKPMGSIQWCTESKYGVATTRISIFFWPKS